MTKFFKAFALVVLCLAVLSVAAFAAEEIEANNDGTFSVTYAEGTANQYYAIVVVAGTYTEEQTPTISEDTVLHIDQVTAGENGAIFDDFIPRTDDAATVYIGGSDLDDGPVIAGYINSEPAVNSYKVSVAVSADSDAAATVVLSAGETLVTAVYNETTEKYEATVAEGTYKLTVNVPKHLSYTKNEFVVAADVEKAVTLKGGDADSSGTVDFDDLTLILNNYKKAVADADVDGSGTVDFDDLTIVLNNYKKTATVE